MLLLVNAAAIMTLAFSAQSTPSRSVPIKLPLGVQLELPRDWHVLSRNQRVALDSVAARSVRRTHFDASSDQDGFTAHYYDGPGKLIASVHLGYFKTLDFTQAEARGARGAEITELDAFLQGSMNQVSRSGGYSISSWQGTERQTINGLTAFVSEYSRSLLKGDGNFRVRLVRVFDGPRSFTLSVSYRENGQPMLRSICDKVIASLRTVSPVNALLTPPLQEAAGGE